MTNSPYLLYLPEGATLPFFIESYPEFKIVQQKPKETDFFEWNNHALSWVNKEKQKLTVDFSSEKLLWRFSKMNKAQEPLLRAFKWKNGESQTLWDLTGGLGRDASLFAYAGFRVTIFERNPTLQLLLTIAHEQLLRTHPEMASRITIVKQDAIQFLDSITDDKNIPQNIYLDPMYPHRKKSALVKLDLRMVRELVGEDPDSAQLLISALPLLNKGASRIVVKRPSYAEFLGDIKPSYSIESPNTRYDVFVSS